MKTLDRLTREWVERQRPGAKALEALERLKKEAMTDPDTRAYLAEMFAGEKDDGILQILNSGLVEQQRRFAKLRRTMLRRQGA